MLLKKQLNLGFDEVLIITGINKTGVEDYFDSSPEIDQNALRAK